MANSFYCCCFKLIIVPSLYYQTFLLKRIMINYSGLTKK